MSEDLTEFRDLLIEMLPAEITAINDAFVANDFTQLRSVVHKLHGAAAFCQIHQLQYAARDLEVSIVNKVDTESLIAMLVELNLQVRKLIKK